MYRYRSTDRLLSDRLQRSGFVRKISTNNRQLDSTALQDFRDALIAEIQLLKTVVCGGVIEAVMKLNLPLVTEVHAQQEEISLSNSLRMSEVVANWRDLGSGCKPIDQSLISQRIGEGSKSAINSAIATTNSIINRLSV